MKDLDQSDYEADGQRMNEELGLDTEDTSKLVSNAMLQRAVRAHMKMADWVPVAITDSDEPGAPGHWAIRTTDIQAEGQWAIDGLNPDGSPHIEILMEEFTSKPEETPTITVRENEKGDWVAQLEGGITVTRRTTTDHDAGFGGQDITYDEPSDDDVVELVDRMGRAAGHWDALKERFGQSLRHGDPGLLAQARDEIPMLVQSLMLLTTAMNRAIDNAE